MILALANFNSPSRGFPSFKLIEKFSMREDWAQRI